MARVKDSLGLWGETLCCGLGLLGSRQHEGDVTLLRHLPATTKRQHGRTNRRSAQRSAHGLGLVRLEVALLARPVPRRRAAARLAVRRRVEQLLADLDAGLDRRRWRGVRAVRHAAGVALAPVLNMAGR